MGRSIRRAGIKRNTQRTSLSPGRVDLWDRAFVRTWDTAWKAKRIRNNSEVEVARSTLRGKPTGPAVRAHARILDGDESAYAGRAIARKHPILHGLLVPLVHRLRRNKTVHIELKPVDS